MSTLILAAPISGWATALGEVPDPAFAEGMVGNGAAIDPVDSILRAPCDAIVSSIAKANHALTLRDASGVEILLHVGIDTVGLNGEGFIRRVEEGANVRRGDPLLELDIDRLARGAKSLVTPVLVTDTARFAVAVTRTDCLINAGEPFLEVRRVEGQDTAELPSTAHPDAAADIIVHLPHGFHARPAARIARISRRFASRVTVSAHGRHADADSSVALMALGIGAGDRVELRGFGADADVAVRALEQEMASACGEPPPSPCAPVHDARCQSAEARHSRPEPEGCGTVASRGLAIGVAQQLEDAPLQVQEAGAGAAVERLRLDRARAAVKQRLRQLAGAAAEDAGDVLAAQSEFLDDPALLTDSAAAIREGKSAAYAWRRAIGGAQELLRATGDARLSERVADLRDIERQVIAALADGAETLPVSLPESAVILAEELLPSQLARLELSKVAGFCTAAGGPTSHVALLAASLGIPAVVGAGPAILDIPNGTSVLLDAETGRLVVEPDAETLTRVRGEIAARRKRRSRSLEQAQADCYTADGRRVRIFANLVSTADAARAVASGAEGCGLLRTEFLFQDRSAAPPEDEQLSEYQAIADALAPRPLVIRLLDAGGDKPLAYLPLPEEANPLLGLRGMRALFRFPELLREQLAAILRVESRTECRILLPMITEAGEIKRVRALIDELRGSRKPVELGAMIETPASVALAPMIARAADFLSIGTNDLAQYTLAMDRAHPDLASAFDYFHPAVLQQVARVCETAEKAGREVSVCGALASEATAAPVLVGLGVHTLSAVPSAIPELKARIRLLSFESCRELGREALAQEDAAALRRLVADFDPPARTQ